MVFAMTKNRNAGFDFHKNMDTGSSGDDNRLAANDFVVRVFKEFKHRDCIYQIAEYMEGRSLRIFLDEFRHRLTKEDVRLLLANLLMCIDAIRALKYAHTKISPDTILVDW